MPVAKASMVDIARELASRGIPVFPVTRHKTPLKDSHGFKDATTDLGQILRWWEVERPAANVATPTGAISGLWALDTDGPEGEASLRALEEKYGALPRTRIHGTGRPEGGRHILFRHPGKDVRIPNHNRGTKLGPKLDIKGDGGLIVAPGSIHKSGAVYQILDESEMADAPDWLLGLVVESRKPLSLKEAGSSNGTGKIPRGSQQDYLVSRAGIYRRHGDSDAVIHEKLKIDYLEHCDKAVLGPNADKILAQIAASVGQYKPAPASAMLPFRGDFKVSAVFAEQHAGLLKYVADRKIWAAWDGRVWRMGDDGAVMNCMRRTVATLWTDFEELMRANAKAIALGDKEAKATVAAAAKKVASAEARAGTIIDRAASESALEIWKFSEAFDRDPDLFCCANGTINLGTGEFREHRPTDMITKISDVTYDRDADCPEFDSWLLTISGGSAELARYLIRLMGYVLSGRTSEHGFWMFYGQRHTAKSTFIKLLRRLAGQYATTLPAHAIIVDRSKNQDYAFAELAGVRLATCVETRDGCKLDEVAVKMITGQDPIKAMRKWENYFEFWSTAKLIAAMNSLPIIRASDDAVWGRVRCIPFRTPVPEKVVDEYQDRLIEKEGSGILNRALAGFEAFEQHGLPLPKEVAAAVTTYRDEMDSVKDFITECCEPENDEDREKRMRSTDDQIIACGKRSGKSANPGELYKKYVEREHDAGNKFPMTQTMFGRELSRLRFPTGHDEKGARARFGLSLKF